MVFMLPVSQRGGAATKEVVNIAVYNFSASCVEVQGKESKCVTVARVGTAAFALSGHFSAELAWFKAG
jgi:hypothetical protein